MRKALRIISLTAGIISVVSAVVLGCIYLEDMWGHLKRIKARITNRINEQAYTGE